MKGFLLGSKSKRRFLYDEKGSSGDGMDGTGGSYVKLLSKCHVVDTTKSSSASEQEFYTLSQETRRDRNVLSGVQNHTVENESNKRYSQVQKSQNKGTFDIEFDRLISNMKPEQSLSQSINFSEQDLLCENLQR